VTRASNAWRVFLSIVFGILVGTFTASIHWLILPRDHALMVQVFGGDLIGALSTIIVCIAIQLREETMRFLSAISCVAIVSELNHRIDSAVFPLCVAAQKIGAKEISDLATAAMEQTNIGLLGAARDAISGRKFRNR
jgi:hypothetical protein